LNPPSPLQNISFEGILSTMDHGQTTNSKNILTKEPKIMKTQNNNSRLRKKQQRPKTQIQDSKK
jgi:hypothetical protein